MVNRQEQTGPGGLEVTRQAWDRIADGYDRLVTPTHAKVANEGLRRTGLERGMRFLDVAAGSGALSLPAARMGADVTAVDLSPDMVGRLEARARREGLDLEARVMDGHALAFPDDAFDVAGSQYGVMLFPDLPRGLREMVRVTRPGGNVLVTVFGPPSQVEFLTFFIQAMRAVVPGFEPPPLDAPGAPMQASDPSVLRRRLDEAGLRHVRVATATEEFRFASGNALWDWLLHSNPVSGMLLAQATAQQQAEVRRELDALVARRAGAGGTALLTAPVLIATGVA